MPQLVEPAFLTGPEYNETLGPEVADLCDGLGFTPDPEQELALDLIFALDDRGRSAAHDVGVVAPRQNLKTGVFKQAALGWLFVTGQRLTVWSAHEFSTTKEAMRDLVEILENNQITRRRLRTVRYSNEDPSIELTSGQRVKFKARTKTGGRGLTGDKTILDEAFALTDDHVDSMLPTLSARPDPQLLYGSTAGAADAVVLRRIRDLGRAGNSERMAWLEWCAERKPCADADCDHRFGVDGCVLDDRELWKAANPLLGRTRANGTGMTFEFIQTEREKLSPAGFARERLGWWDEASDVVEPVFGPEAWEACEVESRPDGGPDGLAVAVSFDLRHAAIGAAASAGGRVHVRPLHHEPGTGWVVDRAKELQDRHGVPLVVDGHGPAAMLIPLLERADVDVTVAATGDVLDACARLFDLVQDREAAHMGYPELDAAVAGAVVRPVGDRWAWGRRKSSSDISPLEAVTLAAWGAANARKQSEPWVEFE